MQSQDSRHLYGRQHSGLAGADPHGYQTWGNNISTPNSESARRTSNRTPIQSNRPPLPASADRRGLIYNSFTSTYIGSNSSDSRKDPPPTVGSDTSRSRRVIFSNQLEIHEKQRSQNCSTPTIPILRTGGRANRSNVPTPRSDSVIKAHSCRDPTPRSGERGFPSSEKRKTINDILSELSRSESASTEGTSSDPPLDRQKRAIFSPAAKSPRDIFSRIALRERSSNHSEKDIRSAPKRQKSIEPEAIASRPLLQSTTHTDPMTNHSWDISDLFPEKSELTTPLGKNKSSVSRSPFATSTQQSQSPSSPSVSNGNTYEPCKDHWDATDAHSDPWNQYLHDRSPSNSSTESQEAILIRKDVPKSNSFAAGRALDGKDHDALSSISPYIAPAQESPSRGARSFRSARPRETSESKRHSARQKESTRYAQLDEEGEVENHGTEVILIPNGSGQKMKIEKNNNIMNSSPTSNRKGFGSLLKRGASSNHIPFQELPVHAMSFDDSTDLGKNTDDTSDSDSGLYRNAKARVRDMLDSESTDSRHNDDDSFIPYYGEKIKKKWKIVFMPVCLVVICLSIGLPIYQKMVVKENVIAEPSVPRGMDLCVDSLHIPDSYSKRYIEMRKVVMGTTSGNTTKVDEPGSAQRKALCWLSDFDTHIEDIDAGSISAIIQRYTMAVLYYSLVIDDDDTERSLKGTDFLSVAHECEWSVVMCGSPKTVTALLLADKVLRGQLPSEIANLGSLAFLELSLNYLSGTIPTSIEKLSMLEYFAVAFNSFSGSIPSQLGSLTMLEFVNMRSSQVNGKIPTELGRLGKLETLLLEGNWLSGTIPNQLGNLVNAQQMSFRKNYLTGQISNELCELRDIALKELKVDSWIECNCCTE